MRAALLKEFGGPEQFVCAEVATPVPDADQMLVRVEACGVCGHDALNRAGYFPNTRLPCVMGHEIAGIVSERGSHVSRFNIGDRVALMQRIPCGSCRVCRTGRENLCVSGPGFYGEGISGGYGDFVLASESNAVAVPPSISPEMAAVLSCAIGTGYHALRRASLQPGDRVLITGASGGVGIHTVKLAALMELECIAVTSSAAKRERLLAAGADAVIVAENSSFHEQVRTMTSGEGVDAVIEITGAPSFASSVRCVRAGGSIVLVGNVEPGLIALNPALAILKEIKLIGSAHALLSDLRKVVELTACGSISPEIAACFPRDEVGEAHRFLQQRGGIGRAVLTFKH